MEDKGKEDSRSSLELYAIEEAVFQRKRREAAMIGSAGDLTKRKSPTSP